MREQESAWDRLLAREQEKEKERLAIIQIHMEAGVVPALSNGEDHDQSRSPCRYQRCCLVA